MFYNFDEILASHGYDIADYQIDLNIIDEFNQVIIVRDITRQRYIEIPVEEHVLDWPGYKLADVVVDAIEDAEMEEKGYI